MSFLGGAIVGLVIGLLGGVILARPRRADPEAGPPGRRSRSDWSGIAIAMAALALGASGVALVRSDRRRSNGSTAPAGSTPTSTTGVAPARPTTTTVTSGTATVSVPNVVGMARTNAEASLQDAGLKASVETLSLANVPAGFVISQTPLPAAVVPIGTTVSLVVSGAT